MASSNGTDLCFKPMKTTSDGAFHGENPLNFALPLLIVQIVVVVVFTRALSFLLRPLRQPRVIAEIIGGILLGPSALGHSKKFLQALFPTQSLTLLETVANIGLLFFLFLVGLELDIRAIMRTGKKALAIALAGICLPFSIGIGTSFILRATIAKGVPHAPFLVFMGVSLSITALPVLARILAELKLLTTDVGRMAMSAAAVNDVAAWVLLALAISLSSANSSPLISLWVLLTGAGFITFAVVTIRPLLELMARRSPQGEPVKDIYICATLTIVLASSFLTDTIGIHALFGAFVIGVIVPKDGPFAGVLIEKIEDIVASLLLPLYFVASGLKTDMLTIRGAESAALFLLIIFNACLGKIGGTVLVSMAFKVPFREALTIGFLMNTKGLVELIVLNIGKDRKVLNDQTFAIMVLVALFNTFMTTPVVTLIYKPARKQTPYKHHKVERNTNADTELRILACFHSTRNIPTMINLLESSRGTSRRCMIVYAMHLMELSERSSAISMVHKARRNGLPFCNKQQHYDGDQIVVAFEAYQQLSSVTIRPMTAISHLTSIHEDICTSARSKRVALILLPFHKHQRFDGTMESLGHGFHHVNEHVLHQAPCSVGILVDRGLGGTTQISACHVSFTAYVLFFGGHDDREALAYGARIAEHPGIKVTIIRFIADAGQSLMWGKNKNTSLPDATEMAADDERIAEIKSKSSADNPFVSYQEKKVGSKDEVIGIIKEVAWCNLFLVGRMPPTAALVDQSDCKELGPVGSYLASSEITTTASVLILKQYDPSIANVNLFKEEEVRDAPVSPSHSDPGSLEAKET